MTASRLDELRKIFTEARRLDREDREAFLDQECRGDPGLREEALALIAADAEVDEALDGSAGGAQVLADALAESGELPAPVITHPERIGKYRIVRVIAEGGMGIVYEAEQDDPRRRVALKVVRPTMVTTELLQRFRQESRVLGHLRHPGIAQIFEAGTADTGDGLQPFFAMELVEGEPLGDYAQNHKLDTAARLELIARLCDILDYAHQKGVIHRDLKPANILVTTEDSSSSGSKATPSSARRTGVASVPSAQPKILDFGVARSTDADLMAVTLQTTAGQLVGTVPYMSPEQASGDPARIDTRSDVYAAGVITYELLTGKLPYDVRGKLVHEAVRVIQEQDPSSLGGIDRRLRGDVETIVAKALEKDKDRRYSSAAELAADLRRYLSDEPIAARPASTLYQVKKFARRNKVLVGGVVATLVVALAGATVATRYAFAAARNAREATRRADALERANYISDIAVANSAVQQQDYATAAAYLDRAPEVHRGWEYDYLRARLVHQLGEWEPSAPLIGAPVFDADGKRMFCMTSEPSIVCWDTASGLLLSTLPLGGIVGEDSESLFHGVALHGPSLRFAVCLEGGDIVIGDMEEGAQARIPRKGPHDAVIAWDADGGRLLYRADGMYVWDGTRSRKLCDETTSHGAFNRSGDRVALMMHPGGGAGGITLLDARTGEKLAERNLDDSPGDIAFSPNGEILALACHNRNVYLLDARTLDDEESLVGHQGVVHSLAWDESGSTLVTTSGDGTARVWDVDGRGSPTVLTTSLPGESRVAIAPGEAYIVVAGEKLIRFPLEDQSVLRGHASFVYRMELSPNGSLLASSGWQEPDILVWDVRRPRLGPRRFTAPRTGGGVAFESAAIVEFSADATRLIAGSMGGTTHWDVRSGAALPVSSASDMVVRFLETLDCDDGERTVRMSKNYVAISLDGERLAVCADPLYASVSGISLYDSGFEAEEWRANKFGGLPGFVIEPGTAPYGRLEGHVGRAYCATFSPDGSRVATGGNDGTVRIWDSVTCEELLVLRGHAQYVMDVRFSPDGTLLASASGDKTIRLWDTQPLPERRAISEGR